MSESEFIRLLAAKAGISRQEALRGLERLSAKAGAGGRRRRAVPALEALAKTDSTPPGRRPLRPAVGRRPAMKFRPG